MLTEVIDKIGEGNILTFIKGKLASLNQYTETIAQNGVQKIIELVSNIEIAYKIPDGVSESDPAYALTSIDTAIRVTLEQLCKSDTLISKIPYHGLIKNPKEHLGADVYELLVTEVRKNINPDIIDNAKSSDIFDVSVLSVQILSSLYAHVKSVPNAVQEPLNELTEAMTDDNVIGSIVPASTLTAASVKDYAQVVDFLKKAGDLADISKLIEDDTGLKMSEFPIGKAYFALVYLVDGALTLADEVIQIIRNPDVADHLNQLGTDFQHGVNKLTQYFGSHTDWTLGEFTQSINDTRDEISSIITQYTSDFLLATRDAAQTMYGEFNKKVTGSMNQFTKRFIKGFIGKLDDTLAYVSDALPVYTACGIALANNVATYQALKTIFDGTNTDANAVTIRTKLADLVTPNYI